MSLFVIAHCFVLRAVDALRHKKAVTFRAPKP
jgi:hypothetical protein